MKTLLPLLFVPGLLLAQATPTVKQAPPPGIAVPEADAAELKSGLDVLGKEIDRLRAEGHSTSAAEKKVPAKDVMAPDQILTLLPDIEVFHKAVRYALQYGEFFNPKEIEAAKTQLKLGEERAASLAVAKPHWLSATGPVVLGYTSKIDGSVQPYGLIVPDDWQPGDRTPRPLYLWFHGRGDTLSEVSFIASRLKAKHDFSTPNAFELHLYGRYCNASKFAGETDCFEAMADVQRRYAIDPNRIVEMGFSMGGATGWHMAAHYPGLWAVGSSGAGFAETAIYAKVDDPKKEPPAPWERKLFSLYDCPPIAVNYSNLPFIAYSGELDPQMQSGQLMNDAVSQAGLKLEWLIGPGVGHKYEPETKKELSRRIDAYVAKGREQLPPHIHFQTYTLRYNQCKWITLDLLEHHWERADIDATLVDEGTIRVTTKNIAAFTIQFPDGSVPLDKTHPPRVIIDEQELVGLPVNEKWRTSFKKLGSKWERIGGEGAITEKVARRKMHGSQGPIDDAFMDSFIFVRPTGKPLNERVGAWAQSEMERAIVEWRKVFRGDVRVKDDTAVTEPEMASANLILWGDPGSNKIIAQLLPRLPIQWTKDKLTMSGQTVSAADHAPIMIYPNPSHSPYIVLNTGFTFREGATTSNSLQTPKLPDWALIDLNTPPSIKWPGKVQDAGFFDEHWQWKKE